MSKASNISPLIVALVAERLKQNITQEYIAQQTGIRRDYISKIESGKFICRYEFIEKYAAALGFELGLVKKENTN